MIIKYCGASFHLNKEPLPIYLNAGNKAEAMESSHQKELLLCALKHFDIEVEDIRGRKVMLKESIIISFSEGPQFHLLGPGQEATFNDVVKLCAHIKTHQEWNEKSGVENSGAGQQ
ncbi:MAG: hypothetical protein H6557_30365 [Lewinellaceae bacterium]|nr:hypothetical protein [Phaeodactylibacter sp.]MCB9040953.1 hypothetical protein [Lewinellaceae bacterium]